MLLPQASNDKSFLTLTYVQVGGKNIPYNVLRTCDTVDTADRHGCPGSTSWQSGRCSDVRVSDTHRGELLYSLNLISFIHANPEAFRLGSE